MNRNRVWRTAPVPRVLVGIVACLALSLACTGARASHTVFEFKVDRFELDGNRMGPFDGVADLVDEFDDGTLSPNWYPLFGTSLESGGFLVLKNPGLHFIGPPDVGVKDLSNVNSLFTTLVDGAGSFTATAIWEGTVPEPTQLIHMTIWSSTPGNSPPWEFIGTDIVQDDTSPLLQQHVSRYSGGVWAPTLADSFAFDEADVSGQIVVRATFDDATNLVHTAFSLDGGSTFLTPFGPIGPLFANGATEARFILGADPEAASTTTTTVATTTTTSTTIPGTLCAPDDLCTGDPCVIPTLTVPDPCVVDFGPRTVVVAGRLKVPSGGTLLLSAGSIQVTGAVIGQGGQFVDQTLVSLTASGSIMVAGPVRLPRAGPGFSRGNLVIAPGGDLIITKPIQGRVVGDLTVDAGGDVRVQAPVRIYSSIAIAAGGAIETDKPLRCGQDLTLSAAAGMRVGRALKARNVLLSAGGDVTIEQRAPVYQSRSVGGRIDVDAAGTLAVNGRLRAQRHLVVLHGAAGVAIDRTVDVRAAGVDHRAGTIEISSSTGPVSVHAPLLASGAGFAPGGTIEVTAAGDLTVDAPVSTLAVGEAAGTITLTSTGGLVSVNENLRAAGTPAFGGGIGGVIRVEGESVQIASGVDVDAVGETAGGDIRLGAAAGGLDLGGRFLTTSLSGPGGIIEGTAAGDLTASGVFRCAGVPDGCIGLGAGGTLDTTGATFDKTPVPDCPGSPSGAFLDPRSGPLD